jgi:hypothetical protein
VNKIRITIGLISILLSTAAFISVIVYINRVPDGYEAMTKFTMYIGTNDKDTEKLEMTLEEAEALVDDIALSYAEIFTSTIGAGKWRNDDGSRTEETTLIYIFYGITDQQAEQIADEVCRALNQSSVLIERSDSMAMFYSVPSIS